MSRDEELAKRRWKVSYSHRCTCKPQCYWTKVPGRHGDDVGIFLNNGEEALGAKAAAELVAQRFRHEDIADIRMWQETEAERDARLKRDRREEANERLGIHWGMGGAN